jgi:hypothetical protein
MWCCPNSIDAWAGVPKRPSTVGDAPWAISSRTTSSWPLRAAVCEHENGCGHRKTARVRAVVEGSVAVGVARVDVDHQAPGKELPHALYVAPQAHQMHHRLAEAMCKSRLQTVELAHKQASGSAACTSPLDVVGMLGSTPASSRTCSSLSAAFAPSAKTFEGK